MGILTQYQPLELNEYIGNGQPWNLNRAHGGVQILPPYSRSKKSEWYKGTANAIYQNFSFIGRYQPEYVLILSGDHIYQMQYDDMLRAHEIAGADCTIAVRQVPLEEASRFGIVNARQTGEIYEFEEKPKQPKSNLASMGIYIFRWDILQKALEEDENRPNSSHDFGKDVLPQLLKEGKRLFAYQFHGYWKDVGTIESLWQANMDLLGPEPKFALVGEGHKQIFCRNEAWPCSFLGRGAEIDQSLVAEGCEIDGKVYHSVISTGCQVEAGAVIDHSVIMPNVTVKAGAKILYSIIAENCVIHAEAEIGQMPVSEEFPFISVVGKEMEIGARVCIKAGEIVEREETP